MKRKKNQIVTIRFDFKFGYVKIVNVKLKKKTKIYSVVASGGNESRRHMATQDDQ